MIENYMDYFPDLCMNTFTADQKARARQVMSVSPERKALISSTGKEVQLQSDLPYYVNKNKPQFSIQSDTNVFEIENNVTVNLSEFIDQNRYGKPLLIFDYQYENASESDKVSISNYNSCINGPSVIKELSYNDLLAPASVDSWKNMYIPLNGFITSYVKPRMEFISANGNLRFRNMRIINISDDLSSQVLRNPFLLKSASFYDYELRKIFVEVLLRNIQDVEIELVDTMGKKIQGSYFANQQSGRFEIYNTGLVAGIYFIRVKAGGQTKVNRILVI